MTLLDRHPQVLARRLFKQLALMGVLAGLALASLQMALEYRHDVDDLGHRLTEIEAGYLASIGENTWLDDRERLQLLAEGIHNLPGIAQVQVMAPDGSVLADSGSPPETPLTRIVPITRDYGGRTLDLGRLEVTAGLDTLRQGALRRLWQTLGGNLALVAVLSGLIFALVHRLVTRRLADIAEYARRLGSDGPTAAPPLQTDGQAQDELAHLAATLSRMHSELSSTHEALVASESRYRELFTSSPVPLWEEDFSAVKAAVDSVTTDNGDFAVWLETNPDFVRHCAGLVRIIDINEAGLQMHRAASRTELLQRLSSVFTPSSYDAFRKQLVAIHQGRHDLTTDAQVRTLDGDPIDVVLHWYVPPAHHANYGKVIVSQEDISDLKAARRDSDITLERLMQANAELERFAFVASHDLREPVRSVVSFTQLLERHLRHETGLSQDIEEYLDFLISAAQRMQSQVAGLQNYAAANHEAVSFAPVPLDGVLAEACATLAESWPDCTVQAGPLPTVSGDRTQLIRLFHQLLDNAAKFRRPDKAPLIRVSAEAADGMWRITVRDNGIGVDADYAQAVFEVFRKLHGPGRYPGAGIGLSICRRIVERHGGSIRLDTSVTDGAAVVFSLPAVDLASATDRP